MPSYVPPKKNTEYIFDLSLVSQANTKVFQSSPTIAAGDFKVSTDNGALGNLTTLPVVSPAASKVVKITVSAAEMNGDNIAVVCSDVAGAEWCDVTLNIPTTATQLDNLVRSTTPANTFDVNAAGEGGLDLGNVSGTLGNANVGWVDGSNRVDVGKWLGTAVTTSATSLKPEIDMFSLSDDAAAANNLELLTENALGSDNKILISANAQDLSGTFDVNTKSFTSTLDLTTNMKNSVNAEVDGSMLTYGLDHFVQTSVIGADVANNSIIARMVSSAATADWDTFVHTTDSLQAIRDVAPHGTAMRGTDSAALATVCTEGRLAELDGAGLPADIATLATHATDIKGTGFVADTHSLFNIEGYADLIDDGTSGLAKIATDVATLITHATDIKGTGFVADTHSLFNIEGYADLIDDGTSGLAKIATDVAAILVQTDLLPDGIKKNTALNNFEFVMVDSTDHFTGKTGLTITSQRSIDGGAYVATSNTAAEVGSGTYKINLSSVDTNGGVITYKFTGTGADTRWLTIVTQT